MDRNIRTVEDVLALLDDLFAPEADRWSEEGAAWWDDFYADRSKQVPFFAAKPDENLVSYVERGPVAGGGRALDLGCGPGRNALFLASHGFRVDAVDLSATALGWAQERAQETGADVRFLHGDAFRLAGSEPAGSEPAGSELVGPYELIYDSGCFHHLPPHRRVSYRALLDRLLAPGGHFGLSCFAAGPGGVGSELADVELYRAGGLQGGLAYSAEALRWVFSDLEEVESRRMRDEPSGSRCFGEPFLRTALFRRGGVVGPGRAEPPLAERREHG